MDKAAELGHWPSSAGGSMARAAPTLALHCTNKPRALPCQCLFCLGKRLTLATRLQCVSCAGAVIRWEEAAMCRESC